VRASTLAYLSRLTALAEALGAGVVAGPAYGSVGLARPLDDAERRAERDRVVGSLREAAQDAAARGVRLALEPLNRFETDRVNTVEQGLRLCDDVGHDAVGLHLDTFHMHLEERDSGAAIRAAAAAGRLFHVHACENDRGVPGRGQVAWGRVADALRDVGYDGDVVIESFTPAVTEHRRRRLPVAAGGPGPGHDRARGAGVPAGADGLRTRSRRPTRAPRAPSAHGGPAPPSAGCVQDDGSGTTPASITCRPLRAWAGVLPPLPVPGDRPLHAHLERRRNELQPPLDPVRVDRERVHELVHHLDHRAGFRHEEPPKRIISGPMALTRGSTPAAAAAIAAISRCVRAGAWGAIQIWPQARSCATISAAARPTSSM
jgi:sugar phosphate isomerase/epimerase